MRLLTYLISLITVIVGVAASGISYGHIRQGQHSRDGLQREISILQDKLSGLDGRRDAYIEGLLTYYSVLYQHIQMLFSDRDYSYGIEVGGLSGAMPLGQAATPSAWEGIRKLTLQLRFTDINDHLQDIYILNSIGHLRDMYPFDIVSIDHDSKGMNIAIDLYGK